MNKTISIPNTTSISNSYNNNKNSSNNLYINITTIVTSEMNSIGLYHRSLQSLPNKKKKNVIDVNDNRYNHWMNASCCMPRQNCINRKTWIKVIDSSVPVMNIFNLLVPLGNTNFHIESYRSCEFYSKRIRICP